MKFKKIMAAVFFVLLFSWGYYGITIIQLFSEVEELTTPGTSYLIKLLEFTNYRGEELSKYLIIFFILISLNHMASFYLVNQAKKQNKLKSIQLALGINIAIVGISSLLANVFWSVYLILAIISGLVVSASYYISNMFFNKKIVFDTGDIIYKSDSFKNEKEAKKDLAKKLTRMGNLQKVLVSSELFTIGNSYAYEIYANNKLILSNEGEILDYEKE